MLLLWGDYHVFFIFLKPIFLLEFLTRNQKLYSLKKKERKKLPHMLII